MKSKLFDGVQSIKPAEIAAALDGQLRLGGHTEVEQAADRALASFTTYAILDSLIRRHKILAQTAKPNGLASKLHRQTAELIEITYERISAMLTGRASTD